MAIKWWMAQKGTFDGWPVEYVDSDEIDAKFAGGWIA